MFRSTKWSLGKTGGWNLPSASTWTLVEFLEVWFLSSFFPNFVKAQILSSFKLLRLCLERASSFVAWDGQLSGKLWKKWSLLLMYWVCRERTNTIHNMMRQETECRLIGTDWMLQAAKMQDNGITSKFYLLNKVDELLIFNLIQSLSCHQHRWCGKYLDEV